ncbi:hypothetical protein K469DRAFT_683558 [Zopfia rhizophila CBS 207.26]|uniref:Uncharacterized protein n=1 Tax=Zopfia rhizophila CBS 207.26 TaxID=1314779 RepID=A0A6A6DB27_9PEZI|nr:hypothetical protein K469DRAFT_683558 [Zopfia rhizophila CBS 207.26]
MTVPAGASRSGFGRVSGGSNPPVEAWLAALGYLNVTSSDPSMRHELGHLSASTGQMLEIKEYESRDGGHRYCYMPHLPGENAMWNPDIPTDALVVIKKPRALGESILLLDTYISMFQAHTTSTARTPTAMIEKITSNFMRESVTNYDDLRNRGAQDLDLVWLLEALAGPYNFDSWHYVKGICSGKTIYCGNSAYDLHSLMHRNAHQYSTGRCTFEHPERYLASWNQAKTQLHIIGVAKIRLKGTSTGSNLHIHMLDKEVALEVTLLAARRQSSWNPAQLHLHHLAHHRCIHPSYHKAIRPWCLGYYK